MGEAVTLLRAGSRPASQDSVLHTIVTMSCRRRYQIKTTTQPSLLLLLLLLLLSLLLPRLTLLFFFSFLQLLLRLLLILYYYYIILLFYYYYYRLADYYCHFIYDHRLKRIKHRLSMSMLPNTL